MTNEQLKVLLETQTTLLEKSIEETNELMPDSADREMEWHCKKKNLSQIEQGSVFMQSLAIGNEKNKNLIQKPTGRYIALVPIYDYLTLLQNQIAELSGTLITGQMNENETKII